MKLNRRFREFLRDEVNPNRERLGRLYVGIRGGLARDSRPLQSLLWTTSDANSMVQGVYGLSPRVRGNRAPGLQGSRWDGSIPACAGEPSFLFWSPTKRTVYPRVCGGTPVLGAGFRVLGCLSPRVRGNPMRPSARRTKGGSIPACAGEPCPPSTRLPLPWVYPRVCGGTFRANGEGDAP